MSVFNKFLNAMKLNEDEDEYEDEEFLDEEAEEEEEPKVRSRFLKTQDDDFEDEDDMEEKDQRNNDSSRSSFESSAKSRFTMNASKVKPKVSPIRPKKNTDSFSMEVCVVRPHSLEDETQITDALVKDCAVILNMEGLDLELAQRIIDFSAGSCYAMNGNLQKISNYIFIITPANVSISGDFQEILTGAFDVPSF